MAYICRKKVNTAHPKGPRFESRSSQRTILLPFLALLYPNLSLKEIKVNLKTQKSSSSMLAVGEFFNMIFHSILDTADEKKY